MNLPWMKLHGAPKVVAICAAVLLVAAGLCGAQLAILAGFRPGPLAEVFTITGALELIAVILSVVVGFIALLVWGFGSMFRRDSDH